MKLLKQSYDRQKIGCFLKRDKNGKYIKDNIRYLTNKNGKKIQILTENRNNFAMNANHKVSRFIIERALDIRSGYQIWKSSIWQESTMETKCKFRKEEQSELCQSSSL